MNEYDSSYTLYGDEPFPGNTDGNILPRKLSPSQGRLDIQKTKQKTTQQKKHEHNLRLRLTNNRQKSSKARLRFRSNLLGNVKENQTTRAKSNTTCKEKGGYFKGKNHPISDYTQLLQGLARATRIDLREDQTHLVIPLPKDEPPFAVVQPKPLTLTNGVGDKK
ncbi:hypothetical protein YC2023_122563 [Brassica napus]